MSRMSKTMEKQHEEMLKLQGLNQISGDDASRLLQGRYTHLRYKTIMGDVIVRNMGVVFEKVIDFTGAVICGSLRFLGNLPDEGKSDVRISKMSIKGLCISGATVLGDIDLSRVIVEEVADLNDAIIKGGLDLGCSHIKRHLNVERSQICGNALFDGMIVDCSILASDIVVNKNLGFQGTTVRENLNIQRATVKGALSLRCINIGGRAFLVAIQVGENADLADSIVGDVLDLGGASIGGSLDLSGVSLNGLNLSCLKDAESIIVDEKMARLVHFSAPNTSLLVKTNEDVCF